MSTIFTKIINKEIPADIIYEDSDYLAFTDINPQAPIHILIIPKKEIQTVSHMKKEDTEIFGNLCYIAKKIAEKLEIEDQGFRLVMNCNEYGGQTVNHIHLHLLAGRRMGWPPG